MTRTAREGATFLRTIHFMEEALFPMSGRVLEVLLMPGFVLAAIPFSGTISLGELVSKGLPLGLATLLLVGSIYAVNTFFGLGSDRMNRRFFKTASDGRGRHAAFASIALAGSLMVFALIQPVTAWLAAAVFALWFAYSAPGGAKARPVWGTLVHVVSQVLQFHLGVLAFGQPNQTTLLVSIFFAALFSSGHLVHEVKDSACDREAKLRTNAVAFGPAKVVSFYKRSLFALPLYWLILFVLGAIDSRQFAPFFVATLGHLALSRRWDGSTLEKNESFQRAYRFLYLAAGLALFALTPHSNG